MSKNFLVALLCVFLSGAAGAQGTPAVDYFEEDSVDIYELKSDKFVLSGNRSTKEIMSQCPQGSTTVKVLAERGRYSQLSCGTGNIWVRSASFAPSVKVDVNCTKAMETPVSKRQVVVVAGTRGAGAEKNGCK